MTAAAPSGRRLCEVDRQPRLRRLPRLLAARPRGPEPAAGPVLHARRRARTGSSEGERPFLPRALSVAETGAGGGRRPARLPDRGRSAPAPTGSASWSRGRGSGSTARSATPSPSRASSRRAPPGRSSSAAASASPRWPCCAAASPSGASRPASCSASATRRTRAASTTSSPAARSRLASEDGHAGHRGYVTDLLATMLAGDDAGSRRRLRLRPAADARGGAGALRRARASPASWRWSRRWPAASAPASAARCR